jgi:hypothetical protein
MIRLPHRPLNIPHPNQLIQTFHKRSQQFLLAQPIPLPYLRIHPKPIIQINQSGRGILVQFMENTGRWLGREDSVCGGGFGTAGTGEPVRWVAEGGFERFAGLGSKDLGLE